MATWLGHTPCHRISFPGHFCSVGIGVLVAGRPAAAREVFSPARSGERTCSCSSQSLFAHPSASYLENSGQGERWGLRLPQLPLDPAPFLLTPGVSRSSQRAPFPSKHSLYEAWRVRGTQPHRLPLWVPAQTYGLLLPFVGFVFFLLLRFSSCLPGKYHVPKSVRKSFIYSHISLVLNPCNKSF